MIEVPAWLIPVGVACVGLMSAVIVALINKRPTPPDPFARLNTLFDQLQEERESDRADMARLETRVDTLFLQNSLHRQYTDSIHAWALAGAPPPPPKKPEGLI